jgi:uncharacterized membrane protein
MLKKTALKRDDFIVSAGKTLYEELESVFERYRRMFERAEALRDELAGLKSGSGSGGEGGADGGGADGGGALTGGKRRRC